MKFSAACLAASPARGGARGPGRPRPSGAGPSRPATRVSLCLSIWPSGRPSIRLRLRLRVICDELQRRIDTQSSNSNDHAASLGAFSVTQAGRPRTGPAEELRRGPFRWPPAAGEPNPVWQQVEEGFVSRGVTLTKNCSDEHILQTFASTLTDDCRLFISEPNQESAIPLGKLRSF